MTGRIASKVLANSPVMSVCMHARGFSHAGHAALFLLWFWRCLVRPCQCSWWQTSFGKSKGCKENDCRWAISLNPAERWFRTASVFQRAKRDLWGWAAVTSSRPTMRLFLLCVYMLLLRASQSRAVSFPEDDEPLNTVDYHCKSPLQSPSLSRKLSLCLSLFQACSAPFSHREIFTSLWNALHINWPVIISKCLEDTETHRNRLRILRKKAKDHLLTLTSLCSFIFKTLREEFS